MRCSETRDAVPQDLGNHYYPLNRGDFRTYRVDGVIYNAFNDSTSFSYFLRESVVDTFTNLELGLSYKILREKKLSESDPWVIDSLWTARKDLRTAVLVENNVPVVKLSFPTKDSVSWDGNRLNDKDANIFTLVNVNQAFSGEFGEFQNTATVIQQYLPDLIVNWISQKEVYAENIGMIYKENIILIFNQDAIGAEIVDSGIRYYMKLLEYGNE